MTFPQQHVEKRLDSMSERKALEILQAVTLNLGRGLRGTEFNHVATLTVADTLDDQPALERAFAATQWNDGPDDLDLTVFDRECRSTSVGDEVIIRPEQGEPRRYICDRAGWTMLPR